LGILAGLEARAKCATKPRYSTLSDWNVSDFGSRGAIQVFLLNLAIVRTVSIADAEGASEYRNNWSKAIGPAALLVWAWLLKHAASSITNRSLVFISLFLLSPSFGGWQSFSFGFASRRQFDIMSARI
jgi:hypothetical protein